MSWLQSQFFQWKERLKEPYEDTISQLYVKAVYINIAGRPMMILTEFLESGSLDHFLKVALLNSVLSARTKAGTGPGALPLFTALFVSWYIKSVCFESNQLLLLSNLSTIFTS